MRRITLFLIIVVSLGLLLTELHSPARAQQSTARSARAPIGSYVGEILSNGGFESSDFSNWPGVSVGGVPATVLFSSAHSGNFRARTGQFLFTKHYKVAPLTTYTLSAWYKTIFPTVAIGALVIKLDWYNANGAYIKNSAVFTESNTIRNAWTLASGSTVAPAEAAYVSVCFDYFGVLDSFIEVDDVSLIGLAPDLFGLYLPLVARQ